MNLITCDLCSGSFINLIQIKIIDIILISTTFCQSKSENGGFAYI